ncbi:hypothetical protein P8452_23839 [Trifolium repens]|nr:hypothetical protein P8452_23839 [Trifolium repens]
MLAGLFLPQSPSRQTLTASRTQEHEIDPPLTAHDSLCLNLSLDELSRADELVTHVCPNLKVPLPKLVQIVEKFEKVNASAKTEHEYISLIAMRLKSIRARYWKDAEAKNPLTSSSALG